MRIFVSEYMHDSAVAPHGQRHAVLNDTMPAALIAEKVPSAMTAA